MRRPSAYRVDHGLDVMMTPMIDVVFLLLVFFVCTAGFDRPEEALPSRLSHPGMGGASAAAQPQDDFEDIVVQLRQRQGGVEYQIGERRYADGEAVRDVLVALAKIDTELAVILNVDPAVPLGRMIDVYDSCRVAGFRRIQFAAE